MVEARREQPAAGPVIGPRRGVLERRDSPRYPTRSIGFRSNQIQASLIDVSSEGLAIESLEHPPIGGTLIFALEQGRNRVDADGQVCWCNLQRTYRTAKGDVVPVYRAGIRLGLRRSPKYDSLVRAARKELPGGHA